MGCDFVGGEGVSKVGGIICFSLALSFLFIKADFLYENLIFSNKNGVAYDLRGLKNITIIIRPNFFYNIFIIRKPCFF